MRKGDLLFVIMKKRFENNSFVIVLFIMSTIFDFLYCKIVIFLNKIPLYELTLVFYLFIPVIVFTYIHYKYLKINPVFLSFMLLLTWLSQIFLWNYIFSIYYNL